MTSSVRHLKPDDTVIPKLAFRTFPSRSVQDEPACRCSPRRIGASAMMQDSRAARMVQYRTRRGAVCSAREVDMSALESIPLQHGHPGVQPEEDVTVPASWHRALYISTSTSQAGCPWARPFIQLQQVQDSGNPLGPPHAPLMHRSCTFRCQPLIHQLEMFHTASSRLEPLCASVLPPLPTPGGIATRRTST